MLRNTIPSFFLYLSCLGIACNDNTEKNSSETAEVRKKDSVIDREKAPSAHDLATATNHMLNTIRQTQYTGKTDSDYIRIMQAHQKAAIEMYRLVGASGANEDLKMLAESITSRVVAQNDIVSKIILSGSKNTASDFGTQAVRIIDSLTGKGLAMHGAYLDLDFSTMMVQHHTMGMEVCRLYVKNGKDPQLLEFAKNQIRDYQEDIQQLVKWKQKTYPDTH